MKAIQGKWGEGGNHFKATIKLIANFIIGTVPIQKTKAWCLQILQENNLEYYPKP